MIKSGWLYFPTTIADWHPGSHPDTGSNLITYTLFVSNILIKLANFPGGKNYDIPPDRLLFHGTSLAKAILFWHQDSFHLETTEGEAGSTFPVRHKSPGGMPIHGEYGIKQGLCFLSAQLTSKDLKKELIMEHMVHMSFFIAPYQVILLKISSDKVFEN